MLTGRAGDEGLDPRMKLASYFMKPGLSVEFVDMIRKAKGTDNLPEFDDIGPRWNRDA